MSYHEASINKNIMLIMSVENMNKFISLMPDMTNHEYKKI